MALALALLLGAFLMTPLLSGQAAAHSPEFPSDNDSLANAWEIHDPSKSWAIYAELEAGQVDYYYMELEQGDRILLNLIVPVYEGDRDFLPVMALMGPGLDDVGTLPSQVEVPEGYGHVLVEGELEDEPTYEPFSPGSYYNVSWYDAPAAETGIYYVAVFESGTSAGEGGNYGFPVGYRETFTLGEMVSIPFSLVEVYLWEGQDYWTIFAPMALMMLIGAAILVRRRDDVLERMAPFHLAVYVAGVLVLGSALITTTQFLLTWWTTPLDEAAIVTIFIIAVQAGLGQSMLRTGLRVRAEVNTWTRVKMALFGVISIFAWAGYIIGPMLAVIGALLPSRRTPKQ
jgi:uncharacterized protein YhhL (DUF1145 family)